MSSRSDSELVCAALRDGSGALAAREEIVQRYHPRVYAFLHQLTGRREDAEDLTQETFLQALRKLKSFKPGSDLLPWLFTIARRRAISQWRREKSTLPLFESDHPVVTATNPHDAVALWNLAKAHLSSNGFTALWLHYQEGLPLKEVARVLGKTTPHIKVIIHRARKRLGQALTRLDKSWLPDQPRIDFSPP